MMIGRKENKMTEEIKYINAIQTYRFENAETETNIVPVLITLNLGDIRSLSITLAKTNNIRIVFKDADDIKLITKTDKAYASYEKLVSDWQSFKEQEKLKWSYTLPTRSPVIPTVPWPHPQHPQQPQYPREPNHLVDPNRPYYTPQDGTGDVK